MFSRRQGLHEGQCLLTKWKDVSCFYFNLGAGVGFRGDNLINVQSWNTVNRNNNIYKWGSFTGVTKSVSGFLKTIIASVMFIEIYRLIERYHTGDDYGLHTKHNLYHLLIPCNSRSCMSCVYELIKLST